MATTASPIDRSGSPWWTIKTGQGGSGPPFQNPPTQRGSGASIPNNSIGRATSHFVGSQRPGLRATCQTGARRSSENFVRNEGAAQRVGVAQCDQPAVGGVGAERARARLGEDAHRPAL